MPLDFANNDGFAPLDLCVRKQQAEVGDVLVNAGAKMVKDQFVISRMKTDGKSHHVLGAGTEGV